MSAYLGFIHYWLYNKIKLVAEREELLYQKAMEVCSETAEELRGQVWGTYGQPLPDQDLAELIDPGNIHGWLQRQINAAETREAAFIKGLVENCGDTGITLAKEVFASHGRRCGEHAREQGKYTTGNADGIYKAFTDYFLNGMPCDQNATLVVNTADQVIWEGAGCQKQQNWSRGGMDVPLMRSFYLEWMKGFVEGINAAFTHKLIADTYKGDVINRHEIARK